MTFYGFNEHPTSLDWNADAVVAHAQRLNSRWQLVQDEAAFAQRLIAACPNTNVILREKWDAPHRDVWEDLGNGNKRRIYEAKSPKQWLDNQLNNDAVKHPRMWLQAGNEAGFGDEWLEWTAELIEENARRGFPVRLVILNCSSGTPEPHDWQRARRVLELANQHRSSVVVGLHEYYDTYPVTGISGVALQSPDVHVMANWPKRDALNDGRALWHVGRYRFMTAYCAQRGIPAPRIVINEHGSDRMDDVKAFADTWGHKVASDQHGYHNNTRVYEHVYPGVDPALVFVQHLEYCRQHIYAGSTVEGVLVFCDGDSSLDRRLWKWFNMHRERTFKDRLEVINAGIASTPPPVEPPPVIPPDEPDPETPPDEPEPVPGFTPAQIATIEGITRGVVDDAVSVAVSEVVPDAVGVAVKAAAAQITQTVIAALRAAVDDIED